MGFLDSAKNFLEQQKKKAGQMVSNVVGGIKSAFTPTIAPKPTTPLVRQSTIQRQSIPAKAAPTASRVVGTPKSSFDLVGAAQRYVTPVVNTVSKWAEPFRLVGEVGKKLQTLPKVESNYEGTKYGGTKPQLTKTGASAVNFLGDVVRGFGQEAETLFTKEGRAKIVPGIKEYPKQIKEVMTPEKRLQGVSDLFSNPATIALFGLTDIVPGGGIVPKLGKRIVEKQLAKGVVKEGVEKFAKEGAEKLVKEETERLVREGAGKLAREEAERLAREGVEKLAKGEAERVTGKAISATTPLPSPTGGEMASQAQKGVKAAVGEYPEEAALFGKKVSTAREKTATSLALERKIQEEATLKARQAGAKVLARGSSAVEESTSKGIISQVENPTNPYFNVNKLNVETEAKQGLKQAIEETKPLIEQKVGKKLSNQEAVDFANGTATTLHKAVSREETLQWEAKMLKARQLLAAQAESGTVTREYIDNLLTIKTQGTDIARKLQSLGISADSAIISAKDAILEAILKVNKNTDEILAAAKGVDFNDLGQATAFYRQFIAPKASEWLDLLRYNSMLSSPNTHIINISSNFQGTGIIAPIEKTILGGVDFLKSAITGKERQYFVGEGAAYTKAYYSNLKEAVHKFADVMGGKSFSGNPDLRQLPLTTGGVRKAAENTLALPMKLLEGMDQFFTTLTQAGEKGGLEYRVAKGITVGNIDMKALEAAQKRLFRGELLPADEGHILGALDAGAQALFSLRHSSNPVVALISKFTFPFVKTPINILKQGVEYSPLGFSTMWGAANKTEQFTKALMGSSIGLATATLVGSDRLSWGEPANATRKAEFRAAGILPYSVKIGDKWVSYSKLHPAVSFNLALAAAVNDSLNNQTMDETQAQVVLEGLSKWVNFFADQSYMKNMGDFIASTKGDVEGPMRYVSGYIQQLIPYRALLGWVTRIVDPYQRQADPDGNILTKQLQQIASGIPFVSESVPTRKGPTGKPIENQDRLFNAFSPARISTENPEFKDIYNFSQEVSKITKNKDVIKTHGTERIMPIYEQAQSLKAEGRLDEKQALLDSLSNDDWEIYKTIKKSEETKAGNILEKQMYPTVKKIKDLRSQGQESEAQQILDGMTDAEYKAYKTAEKALKPPKQPITSPSSLFGGVQ